MNMKFGGIPSSKVFDFVTDFAMFYHYYSMDKNMFRHLKYPLNLIIKIHLSNNVSIQAGISDSDPEFEPKLGVWYRQ